MPPYRVLLRQALMIEPGRLAIERATRVVHYIQPFFSWHVKHVWSWMSSQSKRLGLGEASVQDRSIVA